MPAYLTDEGYGHNVVGRWKLNESRVDLSGNGNDFVVLTPSREGYNDILPGMRGYCFDRDAANVLETGPDPALQLTGPMTAQCTLTVGQEPTLNDQVIFEHSTATHSSEADNILYSLRLREDALNSVWMRLVYRHQSGAGPTDVGVSSADVIFPGIPYHIGIVRTTTHLQFFINGVPDSGGPYAITPLPTDGSNGVLRIGDSLRSGGFEEWVGSIGNIKFADGPFTDANMLSDYNIVLPEFPRISP